MRGGNLKNKKAAQGGCREMRPPAAPGRNAYKVRVKHDGGLSSGSLVVVRGAQLMAQEQNKGRWRGVHGRGETILQVVAARR